MKANKKPSIAARRRPRQARSAELVATILEAAIRVLDEEGAPRLTTVRVAEVAGVSVGSLYQYFPSKEAILFRLQADEWLETWTLIESILKDESEAPADRLRRALVTFFRTERDESRLREALVASAAQFVESPEAHAVTERARRSIEELVAAVAPHVPASTRARTAELWMISVRAVSERVTHSGVSRAECDDWAAALATMFWAHLGELAATRPRGRRTPAKTR